MTNPNIPAPDLEAYGALVARIPEIAELVEYRKSLPADTPSEMASALVMARVQEMLAGQLGVPDGYLDKSVWRLLQRTVVPNLQKSVGALSVRELLTMLWALLGLDALVAGYVESAVSGSPTLPSVSKGKVTSVPAFKLGEFETSPVVMLVATPISQLDELVAELRDTCYRDFAGVPVHKLGTYQELVRMAELVDQGKGRREVTWQLLADAHPEIAAASPEERERDYKPEYTRKRASLRQKFKRMGA